MLTFIGSEPFWAVLTGSLAQELLHWYNLRERIHLKSFRKAMSSPSYWIITVAMLLVSVFGVYFWFDGEMSQTPLRNFFVFGAAFPLIFKSIIKSSALRQIVKLGQSSNNLDAQQDNTNISIFQNYFGV